MIKIKNLTKKYNKGKSNEFVALKNISLEIKDGEMVAVTGKSGAGKSTLLHILACIDRYEEGEYLLNEKSTVKCSDSVYSMIRNEKIGIVIQDFALIDDISALENVMIPLDFSKKRIKNKKERALKALKSVGMEEMAGKLVSGLSGGQKQRTAIARSIVNNPDIILADEPTGALDSENAAEVFSLFEQINQSGKTVIIVTHDMNLAEKCKRKIEISDGKIISDSLNPTE